MAATTAPKKAAPKKSAKQIEIDAILARADARIKEELAFNWQFGKLLAHAGEHTENIFTVIEMALGDDEKRFAELLDNNTEKIFTKLLPLLKKKAI